VKTAMQTNRISEIITRKSNDIEMCVIYRDEIDFRLMTCINEVEMYGINFRLMACICEVEM
jgi:hypothetical protein